MMAVNRVVYGPNKNQITTEIFDFMTQKMYKVHGKKSLEDFVNKCKHTPFGITKDCNNEIVRLQTFVAIQFPSYDEAYEYSLENNISPLIYSIGEYHWLLDQSYNIDYLYGEDAELENWVVYTDRDMLWSGNSMYISKNGGTTFEVSMAQRFTSKEAHGKANAMTKNTRKGYYWTCRKVKM